LGKLQSLIMFCNLIQKTSRKEVFLKKLFFLLWEKKIIFIDNCKKSFFCFQFWLTLDRFFTIFGTILLSPDLLHFWKATCSASKSTHPVCFQTNKTSNHVWVKFQNLVLLWPQNVSKSSTCFSTISRFQILEVVDIRWYNLFSRNLQLFCRFILYLWEKITRFLESARKNFAT